MSKILIEDLPEHQQRALMDGESAIHGGGVVTRADVETRDDRKNRLAAEKAGAAEAARHVEAGLAEALASGELVTAESIAGLKSDLRAELLADDEFRAVLKRELLAEMRAGAPKPDDGAETVDTLMRKTLKELTDLAQQRGVTHETDANKQTIAEALVKAAQTAGAA